MNKVTLAKSYFKEGYNCCQAVLLAYKEEIGLDERSTLALSSSFGGGIGRMREVCGAFSGACMVLGMLYGYTDPKAKEEKAAHYKLIQDLAADFTARNGSIICRTLTGMEQDSHVPTERTTSFYKKRPCVDLVGDVAELLEQIIASKK